MVCIYEVNVFVKEGDKNKDEFLAFLKPHADEMLTFEGFQSYEILLPEPSEEEKNMNIAPICAVYRVESRMLLEKYFNTEASRMRADTMSKFEGRISATRRILESYQK